MATSSAITSRLRDAIRVALFLRVPEERLQPAPLEIVAAILLTVLLPTLYAAVTIAGDGRLASWELPQVFFHVVLLYVAALFAARIVRRPDAASSFLFASLLAWFVIDVVSFSAWIALQSAVGNGRVIYLILDYGTTFWLALAAVRFCCSTPPRRFVAIAGVLAAYVVLVVVPLSTSPHDRALWVKDWSRQANAGRPRHGQVAEEANFYKQPELLARELGAVEPGRKGIIDVFFIGMAGDGATGVFAREVDSVAKLMKDRFGAEGHVIKLENGPNSASTNPIASVTSLREALKRVAASMDVEEDVLVLFLTSHGSQDFHFYLDLWPLDFKTLDPTVLRQALDESGIRNRVVVISACYSGGFVDKLSDDRTLVITAAAKDRNSFGCDNMAEWTYFGRAYFDEALRQTHSFTKAFGIARPLIEQREKAQGFDASMPQMSVGAGAQAKLDALAAQLDNPRTRGTPQ